MFSRTAINLNIANTNAITRSCNHAGSKIVYYTIEDRIIFKCNTSVTAIVLNGSNRAFVDDTQGHLTVNCGSLNTWTVEATSFSRVTGDIDGIIVVAFPGTAGSLN